MSYEELLSRYSGMVDRKLEAYVGKFASEAWNYHPFIGQVYDHATEFLLRKGKRIASCSTLLTYEGYTGKLDEDILTVAVAIEYYRHSILIHDDLVDRDELRRGGKAFHKIFEESFDGRFGESVGVFVGNIFLAQALAALFSTGFERALVGEAVKALARDYRAVNESQVLDILFESKEPTVEEWRVMASKRAASLFRATLGVGAILGRAPTQDLQTLEQAGTCLGYAFDIQDDIIGTFASEEQYGRPTGGDILLRKKPLHIVYAYQMAEDSRLARLRSLLQTPTLDGEKIAQIREVIQETGALEKAKQTAREYAQKAVELIRENSMSPKTKTFFEDFIQFVVESLDWYR